MTDLRYSLVIEATGEPDYFGFYSPDPEGFTGTGNSVGDCIFKAEQGMKAHVALLNELGLPVPPGNPDPEIVIRDEKNMVAA